MPDEFRLWSREIEVNAAGELFYRKKVNGQACHGRGKRFSCESISGQSHVVRWMRRGKVGDSRLPPT